MLPKKYRARLIRKSGRPVTVMIQDIPENEDSDLIINRRSFRFAYVIVRGGKDSTGTIDDLELFVFYER